MALILCQEHYIIMVLSHIRTERESGHIGKEVSDGQVVRAGVSVT